MTMIGMRADEADVTIEIVIIHLTGRVARQMDMNPIKEDGRDQGLGQEPQQGKT